MSRPSVVSDVVSCRDCKDKIREVAGEALLRLIKFLGPMYAAQGESLRTKAAAALANLATDCAVNAKAIAQLGGLATLHEAQSLEIIGFLRTGSSAMATTLIGLFIIACLSTH